MRPTPDSNNSDFHRHTEGIKVKLWQAPKPLEAARTIASFYHSTWGDPIHPEEFSRKEAYEWAEIVASGKGLPNCLETVNLTFSVDGLTRASTHQLVRTRVGAGFGQQNGSNTNWSEFNFRIPESWFQQMKVEQRQQALDMVHELHDRYLEMIEAGVPFQDARYILPMGLMTTLVGTYNLLSLKGTVNRRLCNRMLWETNWVARNMADLTVKALPWVGRSLRSTCEQRGTCVSVSPMFPNACVTGTEGIPRVRLTGDNPLLIGLVDHTSGNDSDRSTNKGHYDWSLEANGNHMNVANDFRRLEMEVENPDIVVSLIDGFTVLARREDGVWRNA